MSRKNLSWTNQRMEQIIGNLLRAGVFLAALLVFVGGIAYVAHFGAVAPRDGVFRGEPAELRSVPGILRGALVLDSLSVIQLGLLVLLATPVVRVAFSVVAFLLQQDRLYALVAAVVLSVLLYSLLGLP